MIKANVISTFVHGASTYRPGDQAEFSPPVFASLAGHGLVTEAPAPHAEQTAPAQRTQRAARTPSNKKAPEPDNKAATDTAAPAADPAASDTPGAVDADPAAQPGDPDATADA